MNQILQELHDGKRGYHSRGRNLANGISRQRYYWPTMREDAIRFDVPSEIMCDNLLAKELAEELPSVLCANRITPKISTVYGYEAILPIESQVPIERCANVGRNSIDLGYDVDALEKL
ncbi:hypothetical protein OSB04_013003 [Centaurea solstitialis]|uniref:Integrase zinc-binding domain-containing protein n=1 Tax=Centaurea solstitialis TaxID=347529 RepID=A0AA38TCE9_9ASTR|nr:hypothetical protein OSB04_013003 [Centaurea solstitialis]